MNIFGIGGWELLLVFIIALIVAGPKRMLQWAYIAGRYLGQLRVMWGQLMEMVQKDLDEAGVDVKLPKDIPTRGDISRIASEAMRPVTKPMQEAMDEYKSEIKSVENAYKAETQRIENVVKLNLNDENGHKTLPKSAPSQDDKPEGNFGTWSGTGAVQDEE